MSLSVERLKELYDYYNHAGIYEPEDADAAEALAVLIAIKEAEPVAWLNPESTNEDYAFSFGPPGGSWNVPLIRKPE